MSAHVNKAMQILGIVRKVEVSNVSPQDTSLHESPLDVDPGQTVVGKNCNAQIQQEWKEDQGTAK